MKPLIIRDTREKQGWTFEETDEIAGTEIAKLDSGDYSIKGLESIFSIERKQTVQELAGNLGEERWPKELSRLNQMPHPYILLEFTMDDIMSYPFTAKISSHIKSRIKIRGGYIRKKLVEYTLNFPAIHFMLCGRHGKETAEAVIRGVWAKNS